MERAVLRARPEQGRIRAVGGDGAHVIGADGRRFLDAASAGFVALLGFSPTDVADRIADAMRALPVAYAPHFDSAEEERLARLLIERAPTGMGGLWLTSSGSTATETALKLAHRVQTARGEARRTHLIARRHAYHGSTIAAMSLSGSAPRRRPWAPYLLDVSHVAPPDAHRCPLGAPGGPCAGRCTGACAALVEETILFRGPETVAAVFVEAVAGAPLAAFETPTPWLRALRGICDRHGVLLVMDEVITGFGRTGEWFGCAPSGIVPDILTLGKGLAGGFLPAGGVLVSDEIARLLSGRGDSLVEFPHGESFTGYRIVAAAGCAVIDHIEANGLVARARTLGGTLAAALDGLSGHPLVRRRNGRGLLQGLEIGPRGGGAYPRDLHLAERIAEATRARGVLVQAGNAGQDGRDGDAITLAPPLCIAPAEIGIAVEALGSVLVEVADAADVAAAIERTERI